MAIVCDCNNVSLNTGIPACVTIADITRCLVFDTELTSAGAVKERTVADLSSFTVVETFLNAPLLDNRQLPTPELENVENIRDEAVFQEFNSGNKSKVRDGFKNFTGYLVQVPRELVGQLKTLACTDFGAYILDKSGNYVGYQGSTTSVLRPILIDKNTLDVQYVETTDAEVAMIMIKFQWKQTMLDENIKLIPANSLDYNCSDLYGLLDVCADITVGSATAFTAILSTYYGTSVQGLVAGDFTLYNETTASSIVITSVTEGPGGTYAVVMPAQTAGDVISLDASKDRYDFDCMQDNTFVAL